ncbi:phospholipid-translocating ATPase [Starmerella bacillaris]|uniref:Sphingoid long-chain base transporter RSB1 n=1 Tax=Starmerella bacillaris TaxID=1247836 RepID=A0AAV5RG14_STABA|nr:phospholipid-translocating ATPase [Starmerella bacillaris]
MDWLLKGNISGFPNSYGFLPNLAANIVASVLFGIVTVIQFVAGIWTKDWWFLTAWTITGGLEFAGYIARIMSNYYPFSDPMFKMQLVCLIIAPAFMAAGLYYQLAVEVTIFGEEFSIFKPMIYTAIFTTGDVISLFVQAAGGGVASAMLNTSQGPATGGWIMVAGIAFQVLVLITFIIMFTIVNYRIFKKSNRDRWNPEFESTRQRKLFKFWIPSICISLLFLTIRSIYRIVELSEGWLGHLIRTERYFLVLDGLMILLGMAPLTVFHPGVCYGFVPINGLHYNDKKLPPAEQQDAETQYSGYNPVGSDNNSEFSEVKF